VKNSSTYLLSVARTGERKTRQEMDRQRTIPVVFISTPPESRIAVERKEIRNNQVLLSILCSCQLMNDIDFSGP
jgi:hypothetical protein